MERILVIDDSPVQANLLKSILDDTYDVTTVHTAESGLHYAKSGDYSLILLDVIMPSINGFEVLALLQKDSATQHIPVILITSLSDFQNEERGLTLGAVDYISKPFHPLVVKARVNTHIKLYQYRTQIERQATLDQLTGVANRRHYNAVSLERWQDAVRLKRTTDFFARYGGEEFVAIILGSSAADAFEHMRGIRRAVEELRIPHNETVSPWVTVSLGGVTLFPGPKDSYDTHLKIADTMLYDAKRFGRNQVVWYSDKMEFWREKK